MEQDFSHHMWSAKVPVRALRPQLPQQDSPGTYTSSTPCSGSSTELSPCLSPRSYTAHVPVLAHALDCTVGTPVSCCSSFPAGFPKQQEPAVLPPLL